MQSILVASWTAVRHLEEHPPYPPCGVVLVLVHKNAASELPPASQLAGLERWGWEGGRLSNVCVYQNSLLPVLLK